MVKVKNPFTKSPKVKKRKRVTFDDTAAEDAESDKTVKLKVSRTKVAKMKKSKKVVEKDIGISVKHRKVAAQRKQSVKELVLTPLRDEDSDGSMYNPELETDEDKDKSVECVKTRKNVRKRKNAKMSMVLTEAPKDVPSQELHSRDIEIHCRPSAIADLVNHLNQKQKDDIEEIGFGGMLLVKMQSFYKHLVPWLLTHFNPHGQVLKADVGKEYVITTNDVLDIFGLPKGKEEVLVIKKIRKKKIEDEHYMTEIRNLIQVLEKEALTTVVLADYMLKLKDGSRDFKRLFVLYVCSVFLAPTANGHVDLFLAKAVADVDAISKMDWCHFVLTTLCSRVAKWLNKREKGENPKRVKGCILLLEISYFQRFVFKGEPAPTEIPLIQHWTDTIVSKRLTEKSQAGFSTSPLDEETYPICSKKKITVEQSCRNSFSSFFESSSIKTRTMGRTLEIELPHGILTNEEIKEKAKDEFQGIVLLFQRDLELMSLIHMRRLNEIKEMMKQRKDSQNASNFESQDWFNDVTFSNEDIDRIDQLVEKFFTMKTHADSMS